MKRLLLSLAIPSIVSVTVLAAEIVISDVAPTVAPAVVSTDEKADIAREPADACSVCRRADEITQIFRKNQAKGVDAAEDFLGKVKFSPIASVRDQEIASVLKLAVLVIPKDDEGNTDEYLYDAYVERTADFDHQIAALPAADQKVIRESLKHSKSVSENGNG